MTSGSEADVADLVQRFEAYLDAAAVSDYNQIHRVRFIETLRRMGPVLTRRQRAVELGGLSRVASFLAETLAWDVTEYFQDLRMPLSLDTDTFDVVLMLEVLEHLNDRHTGDSPIEEIAMFTGSGAISCLREVHRILKPGGVLVLTTPNAASVDVIGRTLLKMHPFQYEAHVREYAPRDVETLAVTTGFAVEMNSTFFCWNALQQFDRKILLQAIAQLGYDESGRGDDAFYLFRKQI